MSKSFNYIFFILFITISCNRNGVKYHYQDSIEALDNGDPYGSMLYKENDASGKEILIYDKIIKYGENKHYIIILQKPNKNLMIDRIKSNLEILNYHHSNKNTVISFPHIHTNTKINKKYNRELDSLIQITQDTVKAYLLEAERIFQNEPYYQQIFRNKYNYFIIDKKKDTLYGPMQEKEYLKKRGEFDLKLEFGEVLFWKW
ncbi:Uncharacterised protein [Weeksella virosa]|uniref:hypothetical protein n=1 Tax=Weeksella virosa TaxID=1014 RepID=UPI000E038926|nr:hypothetical protein [Weeksella virosa]SUP53536.1 Uncharacterised protein [Weeksella virosa]